MWGGATFPGRFKPSVQGQKFTHLALQHENLLSPAPPGPRGGQELLDIHIFPDLAGQNLKKAGSSARPGERVPPEPPNCCPLRSGAGAWGSQRAWPPPARLLPASKAG